IGLLEAPPKSDEEARHNSTASPVVSTRCTSTPPNDTQTSPTATSEISPNNPGFAIAQEGMIEHASLEGIAEVFDKYMCDAIRRVKIQKDGITSSKAAVTMDFPLWGLVDCLMSLDVRERDVEQLAMALFNVQVESVGHARYVTLTGGVRLTPNPEVTLKGVLDEAIILVFGPEVHGAITACGMRRKELEEGSRVTECVSMILTGSPDEGAIINLSLGLKGGAQIRNKLYT
ncbi:hypothetical protein BGZ57DRAFT_764040, partial [Hyaloscypha finlandica]